MCFVWISEQTAIISLYNINWLVCVTERECVYYAVRTGSLNAIQSLKRQIHYADLLAYKILFEVTKHLHVKVKWSRYRPGVAQRVGRGITLLFHDRGTRRGWVVSSTPRPHFTSGKDPVPILQEARWAPRLVWTGGKSRPHRDSIPDRPARSQSLYRVSYPVHSI